MQVPGERVVQRIRVKARPSCLPELPARPPCKALGANRTYQVAANPGRHLVSSRGAPLEWASWCRSTCKVAYHPVGHLASTRRASFDCKVAYLLAGHFASARRASFTCKVAYHPIGHLASSQRASFTCKISLEPVTGRLPRATDGPPTELNHELSTPSEARPCCKPRPAGAHQTKAGSG